jgi:predicted negative regulator of RcsB-dependent stress response
MRRISARRGSSNVQWIIIATVMVVGMLIGWTTFGTASREHMNGVADDIGDTKKLVDRFSE